MITFFRKIRQSIIGQNKTTRYLAYAIGEIMLVMVGILLALALNEWNSQRKNQAYLSVMLQEIHKDLKTDQRPIYSGIEPRLKYIEEGLKKMKRRLHLGDQVPLDGIGDDYVKMKTSFRLSVTTGSYDALKAKGIEIIKNDTLRLSLFYFYETQVPRALTFIHKDDESLSRDIYALENEILIYETNESENGEVWISSKLKNKGLAQSQNLYQIVDLINDSAVNKRYRLDGLKDHYTHISSLLEEELSRRSISFTPFDSTLVKPDF